MTSDLKKLLYEGVEDSFKEGIKANFKEIAHDYYQTLDKGHGRIETRRYWTIMDANYLKYLDPKGEWQDLKSIGMVEAERLIKGEVESGDPILHLQSVGRCQGIWECSEKPLGDREQLTLGVGCRF